MAASGSASRSGTAEKVVAYFAGCTTNYTEPEIGEAVVGILEKLGMRTVYPEQCCCAIPQLAAGEARAFRKSAELNMRSLSAAGADVVTACTSCLVAIKYDYPKLLGEPQAAVLKERTHDVMEYLVRHWERDGMPPFAPVELSLAYHAPCHLVILGDELIERRLALLRSIPGLTVTRVDRGCCGIGGTFGMKCRNYQMSMAMGEALFAALKELKPDMVISECPTCRSQIGHGTRLPVADPVMIIRRALRPATVDSGPCTAGCGRSPR